MVPFAEGKRASEFGRALVQKLTQRVTELREEIIPPQNVSNMPHGHGWTFQQQRKEGFALETGEFKNQSTEFSVNFERILSNDLSLVEEFIIKMAQQMHDELVQGVLMEVDETCNRFNRVTSVPKGASLADSILAGLTDVHASVDEDGTVSYPQLMLSPDLIERLKLEVAVRGEELERKAAEIRAQAEKDAKEREAERLAKYERQ